MTADRRSLTRLHLHESRDMTLDLFLALAFFAFSTSITPGPNNLMLMSSGVNFGFMRTIPHMLGVGIGFVIMLILLGAGLLQVFDRVPGSYDVLRVVALLYTLWLAWKTATAAQISKSNSKAKPLTFLQAAAFQWVNPKAWAMGTTALTSYAPDRSMSAVLLVSLIFGVINLPSVSAWTLAGDQLTRFLKTDRQRITINVIMALLLIASMIPVILR